MGTGMAVISSFVVLDGRCVRFVLLVVLVPMIVRLVVSKPKKSKGSEFAGPWNYHKPSRWLLIVIE
jgi:hypothetical protein